MKLRGVGQGDSTCDWSLVGCCEHPHSYSPTIYHTIAFTTPAYSIAGTLCIPAGIGATGLIRTYRRHTDVLHIAGKSPAAHRAWSQPEQPSVLADGMAWPTRGIVELAELTTVDDQNVAAERKTTSTL